MVQVTDKEIINDVINSRIYKAFKNNLENNYDTEVLTHNTKSEKDIYTLYEGEEGKVYLQLSEKNEQLKTALLGWLENVHVNNKFFGINKTIVNFNSIKKMKENDLLDDYAVITLEEECNEKMYLVSRSEIETVAVSDIYEDVLDEDDTECEVIKFSNKFGNNKMLINNPNEDNQEDFSYVDDEIALEIINDYVNDNEDVYKFIPQKFGEYSFYLARVEDADYEENEDDDEEEE